MRDIGAMGESYFKFICNSVGLVANSSEIDKTGWDFIVEFPFQSNPSVNADLTPSPIECRIQVKSTDKRTRKIQIKLSNLLMLAKAHTPAFIYFVEFDNENTPKNTFLYHLDNNVIYKILKKSREISITDNYKKLNKTTLTINYDDSHLLPNLDGNCLKEKIKDYVGKNYAKYSTEKIKYLKEVGYENECISMSFTTSGVDNVRSLIDSSLGIYKKTKINDLIAVETRFGMESKEPFIKNISGTLEFQKIEPLCSGRIIFKETKVSSPIILNCKLYNSPFNSFVDKELVKIKLEGDFFTISINLFSGSSLYNFYLNSIIMPLYKLRDAIMLMELMTNGNKSIDMHFDFNLFPKNKVSIKCKNEGRNWTREKKIIENAIFLVERFKIPNDIETTINQLFDQRVEHSDIISIINAVNNDVRIKFSVESGEVNESKSICVIYISKNNFIDRKVILITSFIGNATPLNNEMYTLNVLEKKIEMEVATTTLDELSDYDIESFVKELSSKYLEKDIATFFIQ